MVEDGAAAVTSKWASAKTSSIDTKYISKSTIRQHQYDKSYITQNSRWRFHLGRIYIIAQGLNRLWALGLSASTEYILTSRQILLLWWIELSTLKKIAGVQFCRLKGFIYCNCSKKGSTDATMQKYWPCSFSSDVWQKNLVRSWHCSHSFVFCSSLPMSALLSRSVQIQFCC